MNADAELDLALWRQAGVAFDQAVLHFDRAANGIDHAAEFDQTAIASPLNNSAVMRGYGGIDQVPSQRPASARPCVLRPSPTSRL